MSKRGKPFAKGRKKTGGRVKGTPNRPVVDDVTLDLIETLKANNFNLAAEMIKIHAEAISLYRHKVENDKGWGAGPMLDTAARTLSELMRYTYPQRRPVDAEGKTGMTLAEILDAIETHVSPDKSNDSK